MADAPDLGSGPARVGGSSPLARTIFANENGIFGSVDTDATQKTSELGEAKVRLVIHLD